MSAGDPQGLSYATTVSRQLVHRAAVCEVFLTDSVRLSDTEFHVAAQLPRVHSYYSDHAASPASYDPLLLLEVFRQTSILLTHKHLSIPQDSRFVFNSGDLRVIDTDALRVGPLPGHAVVDAAVVAEKRRDGQLVGVTLEMRLAIDERRAASMTMSIQWMPPGVWNGLRERGRAGLDLSSPRPPSVGSRLTPESVGRTSPRNVVLREAVVLDTEVVAQVEVDQSHPALFDHPLDHIPGALLFEACRQTAVHAAHELLGLSPRLLTLHRCAAEFTRFGEFELATTCRAELVEDPERSALVFELQMLQDEAVISTAQIALKCTSPAGQRVVHAAAAAP
ncbi:hypothetical protein HCC61_04710 [Streptomyces sp. HNM0575]|uniref:ScbA/BarX family gamma-butyrolactone biosynthesis protein n=1 Tax=Streptomyces sp. HNM0575 TaxID=2716338 RepID=UPI00145D4462|nr:ScbA/BarX family gamma-butyrolactone biosynthesis protein [Streptomyces sp. HNM0575]NLU71992.1 hypothetical protein [Streptomyces sp. HNM0575]